MRFKLFPFAAAMLLTMSLAHAQEKEPVRIGVPTALTGPYADLGDQVRRSINFAVDRANAAGGVDGRQVEVRFLDTQARAEMARQQAEKLTLGGFRLLMGAIASGEALAMAPMLERWNALYVSSANKANDVTGASCSSRMFRVNRPDYADAAVVKPWLETREETKWAIVAADTVKTLGEATKGIWGIINYSSTLDSPENKEFVTEWAEKYPGTTPSNFEGETYVAAQVLFQAIQKAGSVEPGDVSKVLSGGTFHTILGEQHMRKEDHQLTAPNFFGYVGLVDGKWKPIIQMSLPADVATPAPDGSCKKGA